MIKNRVTSKQYKRDATTSIKHHLLLKIEVLILNLATINDVRSVTMKIFVITSLFVVCATACCIHPDWTAVTAKSSEIEATVKNLPKNIVSIANEENSAVGAMLQAKGQVTLMETSYIVDRVNESITKQDLTEAEARVLVGQIKGAIGKLKGSIAVDILKLTPLSAAKIRATFDATFDTVNMRAEELYALLH